MLRLRDHLTPLNIIGSALALLICGAGITAAIVLATPWSK